MPAVTEQRSNRSAIVEEYRCPACEGYIESKFVVSHIDWDACPPTRSVQCRCTHCSKTYHAEFRLRDGAWRMEEGTAPQELVRKADLQKFERALARKRVA